MGMNALRSNTQTGRQISCPCSDFKDPFILHLKAEFFLPLSSFLSFSMICVIICCIPYKLLFILVQGFKAISQINLTGSINSDSVFFPKLRERKKQ